VDVQVLVCLAYPVGHHCVHGLTQNLDRHIDVRGAALPSALVSLDGCR